MKLTKTVKKQIEANITLGDFIPKGRLVNVLPPYVEQYMFTSSGCMVLACVYPKKYDSNVMNIYNLAKKFFEDDLIPVYLHLSLSMSRCVICLMVKNDNIDLRK